jgi:hypothetical protein
MGEEGHEDEEDRLELTLAITNDVDQDTAAVVQMAALMLANDGASAYLRACEVQVGATASTLTMAASMVATLAEHLAEHEGCASEQILLELRNWMNDPGEEDG